MFECDEDFVERIIKLNSLGIITEFSCSGHKNVVNTIRTEENKTISKDENDYSFPYVTINTSDTDPKIISVILAKAFDEDTFNMDVKEI